MLFAPQDTVGKSDDRVSYHSRSAVFILLVDVCPPLHKILLNVMVTCPNSKYHSRRTDLTCGYVVLGVPQDTADRSGDPLQQLSSQTLNRPYYSPGGYLLRVPQDTADRSGGDLL